MARLATAADAPTIAALWNAARPIMEHTMPPFEPLVVWDKALVLTLMARTNCRFYIEPDELGFFYCQPNIIPAGPHAGETANELNIWITKLGLTVVQRRAALRALFRFWFYQYRGKRCWGAVPISLDMDSLAICEEVGRTEWGWVRTDYHVTKNVDHGEWRLYVFDVPANWKAVG
jgi:hypothetical protein